MIEEAMPEHKKVKKTTDVDVQNMAGGAQIYIPMKRKRKPKMPKNFDPENPGPMPLMLMASFYVEPLPSVEVR